MIGGGVGDFIPAIGWKIKTMAIAIGLMGYSHMSLLVLVFLFSDQWLYLDFMQSSQTTAVIELIEDDKELKYS